MLSTDMSMKELVRNAFGEGAYQLHVLDLLTGGVEGTPKFNEISEGVWEYSIAVIDTENVTVAVFGDATRLVEFVKVAAVSDSVTNLRNVMTCAINGYEWNGYTFEIVPSDTLPDTSSIRRNGR